MKIRYLATCALVSFSCTVFAGDSDRDMQFETLDTNNDGFLTQAELSSVKELANRLNSLDTNKDGKVEKAEFARLETTGTFVPAEGENEPIGAAPTQ